VLRVHVALFAVLGKLNFTLHQLFVFAGVVVRALARHATQLDEVFAEFGICHENFTKFSPREMRTRYLSGVPRI